MSAAAPNPSNMIALAAVGVGAYWFFSRRAMAAPAAARPVAPAASSNAGGAGAILGSLVGLVKGLGGSGSLLGTADGRSATIWDVTPQGADGPRYNNPSAYVSSAVDGAAYNPAGNVSPYDAVNDYSGESWY